MRKLLLSIAIIFLTSGSINAGEMYQDSTGKWLNSAGGNLYGDSTLNWEADPTLNWKADPSLNWQADPSLSWNGIGSGN